MAEAMACGTDLDIVIRGAVARVVSFVSTSAVSFVTPHDQTGRWLRVLANIGRLDTRHL